MLFNYTSYEATFRRSLIVEYICPAGAPHPKLTKGALAPPLM